MDALKGSSYDPLYLIIWHGNRHSHRHRMCQYPPVRAAPPGLARTSVYHSDTQHPRAVDYLFDFFGSVHGATDLAYLLDLDELFNRWFPALVGILAIGVIAGSYSVEVFRGAFL